MKRRKKKKILLESKKIIKKRRGFTLVELIIVIGIIALLATLAIVSMTKARMQARDSKRAEDTRTVVLGLESYYNRHSIYPSIITPGQRLEDSDGTLYINQIPSNPTPRNDGFCPNKDFHYETFNNGQNFMLTFCLGDDKGSLNKGINFYQSGGAVISCGNPIIDRDGYTYSTIQIGGQCWLKENLRTRTKPNHTPLTNLSDGSERDCSNTVGIHGTEADCNTGNAIYLWEAAMNGSTTPGAQGICMDGWHIPTDEEWHELESFLKNPGQSCNPNRNNAPDCDNTGEKLLPTGSLGFNTSLPGGRYTDTFFTDSFFDFDYSAFFWSSTQTGSEVQVRTINIDETRIIRAPIDNSTVPYISASVRCIKNY